MAAPSSGQTRWLFGPWSDLLLGCGGAYAFVFLLLAAGGDTLPGLVPHAMMPLLLLFTTLPHYGATLLRVYERGADRRGYRFFAVWATLGIYAWFAGGVYALPVGSWLVTLYLTWSPWHYSGQNYGIALMFLRRRGVHVTPLAKRWLYTSFLLSFVLTFLAIHTGGSADSYAPGSLGGSTYSLVRLGIPVGVSTWLLLASAIAYLVSIGASLSLLLREGRLRDLFPALALVGMQALWFSIPVLSRATGVFDDLQPFASSGTSDSEYAFLWIAVAHAVQYLWVTTYYALQSDARERRVPYLGRAIAAGGAVWGIPLLLFGPDVLGVRGYDAGLALLIASAVNVHHFILDGAIWKLRDGRIARILLRPRELPADHAPLAGGTEHWIRRGLLVAGVVYAVTFALGTLEYEYGVRRAGEALDVERMRIAAKRLPWLGRDDGGLHHNLGVEALRRGDLEAARRAFTRSIDLQESARGWTALGILHQREGDWAAAGDAYQRALRLEPDSLPALIRSATVWRERGETDRARRALGRALELAPERADLRQRLAALDAASGS